MKSYEVKNIRGQLIDVERKKRIILKRGGKFIISGKDDQFEEKDEELLIDDKPLNSEEKKIAISETFHDGVIMRIADAKTEFFYRIGLRKKTSEDFLIKEYFFDATILEDLYIHTTDGKKWIQCPCLCETSECLYGGIDILESVRGESLNNLFANMVTTYFPKQRSTSCNAFSTFYVMERDRFNEMDFPVFNYPKVSLNQIRKRHALNIFEVDNNK